MFISSFLSMLGLLSIFSLVLWDVKLDNLFETFLVSLYIYCCELLSQNFLSTSHRFFVFVSTFIHFEIFKFPFWFLLLTHELLECYLVSTWFYKFPTSSCWNLVSYHLVHKWYLPWLKFESAKTCFVAYPMNFPGECFMYTKLEIQREHFM